ncbi:MAG: ABC transporter permease [Acidobacteriia bacterium]|nr:ABC transporter permease [Terriglobia bacterium]
MSNQFREIWQYRDFFHQLVLQQLRQRYQSSILGFLWTLLNPLLTYVSFCLVFSYVNHWDLREYGIYFFSGYMAWTFFAAAIGMAADSIVFHSSYVTRVYIPKAILPLACVAVCSVDLAASFAVLGVVMWVLGAHLSMAMLILPVSAALLVIFVTGVGLLAAMWTVFFRDFRHFLNSILFIWFFFCPILYRLTVVPERARFYFSLNPMNPFINLFQMPISASKLPAASDLIVSASLALAALILGFVWFHRSESRFYYYV